MLAYKIDGIAAWTRVDKWLLPPDPDSKGIAGR